MTDRSLTLAEMAERYAVSPKTFLKYVKQYQIPFEALGRSKRFDPGVVRGCLRAVVTPEAPAVVKLSPVVAKSKKSKFAEAVGI